MFRLAARMKVLTLVGMVAWLSLAWAGYFSASARTSPPNSRHALSPFEQQVLAQMNRVRANPPAYAAFLVSFRKYYQGRLLKIPGQIALQTVEGVSALNGAIRALRAARAAPPLLASPGMSLASRSHVADIGPRGLTSHIGSDGGDTFKRLDRFGRWQQVAGENIQYGARSAEEAVLQLLVDDGVPSRGHRTNILNPRFRVTGIACGPHARYRTACVITFAAGYLELR